MTQCSVEMFQVLTTTPAARSTRTMSSAPPSSSRTTPIRIGVTATRKTVQLKVRFDYLQSSCCKDTTCYLPSTPFPPPQALDARRPAPRARTTQDELPSRREASSARSGQRQATPTRKATTAGTRPRGGGSGATPRTLGLGGTTVTFLNVTQVRP